MSKKNIITGVVAGAVIGFAATLFNKENRDYEKKTTAQAFDAADYYVKHPDAGVENLKSGITKINTFLSENSSKAIDTLEQTEDTLKKFLK